MFGPVSVVAYGILISALVDYGSRLEVDIIQHDGQNNSRYLILRDVGMEGFILLVKTESIEIINISGPGGTPLNNFCFFIFALLFHVYHVPILMMIMIFDTVQILIEKVFKRKRPVKKFSFVPVMNESGDRRELEEMYRMIVIVIDSVHDVN